MTYQNTYKFLQNVLANEDVSTSIPGVMTGGGCCKKRKTKKRSYVSREEYNELLEAFDNLRMEFLTLEKKKKTKKATKKRKGMKGGDDLENSLSSEEEYLEDENTSSEEEYENYSSESSSEEESNEMATSLEKAKSKKKKTSKTKAKPKKAKSKKRKGMKGGEESEEESNDEEDFEVPSLEGGADADEILKELGDFNNSYFRSIQSDKPVLKGGAMTSSGKFNYYPY